MPLRSPPIAASSLPHRRDNGSPFFLEIFRGRKPPSPNSILIIRGVMEHHRPRSHRASAPASKARIQRGAKQPGWPTKPAGTPAGNLGPEMVFLTKSPDRFGKAAIAGCWLRNRRPKNKVESAKGSNNFIAPPLVAWTTTVYRILNGVFQRLTLVQSCTSAVPFWSSRMGSLKVGPAGSFCRFGAIESHTQQSLNPTRGRSKGPGTLKNDKPPRGSFRHFRLSYFGPWAWHPLLPTLPPVLASGRQEADPSLP